MLLYLFLGYLVLGVVSFGIIFTLNESSDPWWCFFLSVFWIIILLLSIGEILGCRIKERR